MIEVWAAAVLGLVGQPATQPVGQQPSQAEPPRHPLVTEILYAVPTGAAGDANADGKRDANGDEFVELVNPHDKPIQLAGYVIADKELEGKSKDGKQQQPFTSLRFKFPAMTLAPGQVVVVFNGHQQTFKGPMGTAAAAPGGANENFHGAFVFSMGGTSRQGLANKGDCIQVIAPDGSVVQAITWGDGTAPKGAAKTEPAPMVTRQSIQRSAADRPMEAHPDHGGKPFSPGLWPLKTGSGQTQETKPGDTKPK